MEGWKNIHKEGHIFREVGSCPPYQSPFPIQVHRVDELGQNARTQLRCTDNADEQQLYPDTHLQVDAVDPHCIKFTVGCASYISCILYL